jgi:hypothetical protein
VVTVAEYKKIKIIDMFLVFEFNNFRPANMPPVINNGSGHFEVSKLKMLDKVGSLY